MKYKRLADYKAKKDTQVLVFHSKKQYRRLKKRLGTDENFVLIKKNEKGVIDGNR